MSLSTVGSGLGDLGLGGSSAPMMMPQVPSLSGSSISGYDPSTASTLRIPGIDSPDTAADYITVTPTRSDPDLAVAPRPSALSTRSKGPSGKRGKSGKSVSFAQSDQSDRDTAQRASTADTARRSSGTSMTSKGQAKREAYTQAKDAAKRSESTMDAKSRLASEFADPLKQIRNTIKWDKNGFGDEIQTLATLAKTDTTDGAVRNLVLSTMKDLWTESQVSTAMPSILANAKAPTQSERSGIDADTLTMANTATAQLRGRLPNLRKLDAMLKGKASTALAGKIAKHFALDDTIQTAKSASTVGSTLPSNSASTKGASGMDTKMLDTLSANPSGMKDYLRKLKGPERQSAIAYVTQKGKERDAAKRSTPGQTSGATTVAASDKTTAQVAAHKEAKASTAPTVGSTVGSTVPSTGATSKGHNLPTDTKQLQKYLTDLPASEKPSAIAQLNARNAQRQAASSSAPSTASGTLGPNQNAMIRSMINSKMQDQKALSSYVEGLKGTPAHTTATEYMASLVKQHGGTSSVATTAKPTLSPELQGVFDTWKSRQLGKEAPTTARTMYLTTDPRGKLELQGMVQSVMTDIASHMQTQLKSQLKTQKPMTTEYGQVTKYQENGKKIEYHEKRDGGWTAITTISPEALKAAGMPVDQYNAFTSQGGPTASATTVSDGGWSSYIPGMSSLKSLVGAAA